MKIRMLLAAVAVWLAAAEVSGAQECKIVDFATYDEPVVPIASGRTWLESVAAAQKCQIPSGNGLSDGFAVLSGAGGNLGKTRGIYVDPDTQQAFLGVISDAGVPTAISFSEVAKDILDWEKLGYIEIPQAYIVDVQADWTAITAKSDPKVYSASISLFNPYQEVEIDFRSTPSGATVWVSSFETGKTQIAARVAADQVGQISLTLDGYESCEFEEGEYKPAKGRFERSLFSCQLVQVSSGQ